MARHNHAFHRFCRQTGQSHFRRSSSVHDCVTERYRLQSVHDDAKDMTSQRRHVISAMAVDAREFAATLAAGGATHRRDRCRALTSLRRQRRRRGDADHTVSAEGGYVIHVDHQSYHRTQVNAEICETESETVYHERIVI